MQRFLVAIIVVLAALLLGREPRVERADSFFVSWLLRNTQAKGEHVPLTIIEIGRNTVTDSGRSQANARSGSGASPLEFALFLQSILEFKPTILAIEPVLRWREHDKDQEQIFLDQAMRIPKLLLGAELTATPDPDQPTSEIPGFIHVTGRRGDLPTFTGIAHQPDEDVRLISTLVYTNLPEEVSGETRVPLLFNYRGEVIPAFALQTFLVWAHTAMSEVQVDIGNAITLPHGRRIPINFDGSLTITPNAARLGRHFTMEELLVLAQQRAKNPALDRLHEDLLLVRTPDVVRPDDSERIRQLRASSVLAAAIATMQSNRYVQRISVAFDCIVLLVIALLAWPAIHASRVDVILGAIALSAAYCLTGFVLISQRAVWIPGMVPLSAIWLLTIIALLQPRAKHKAEPVEIAPSPPAP